MSRILIVEDEEQYRDLYESIFRKLNVPADRCHFSDDYDSAFKWVERNAHELQVALVDLKIPQNQNELLQAAVQERPEELVPRGFDLIRAIRKKNRDCEVVIISNYTDERPERKILASLREEGVWVDSVLHKQKDLDMENMGGIDLLRSYVEPVNDVMDLLAENGIYACHPRLEKIVRRLSHIYRNLPEHWPMPSLLLHGHPGAGKNGWAKAAACIKAGSQNEVVFEEESLGTFTDPSAGDSVGAKLFGARLHNNVNAAGLFEKATLYSGQQRDRLATESSIPDYLSSGVAFLDELDSAPTGLIDNLLYAMSEGQVKTVGLKSTRVRIGCSLIFASIQGTSLLHNEKIGQYERGEKALVAFFNRILPNHIIEIPDLQDLGIKFARNYLSFKAGGDLSIQPAADDLLVEGVESGVLNMRKLTRINVPNAGRLTYDDVQRVFGVFERQPASLSVPRSMITGFSEKMLGEAKDILNALEDAAEKVLKDGKKITKGALSEHFVSPSTDKKVSPQRDIPDADV